jgi:phospholipase C
MQENRSFDNYFGTYPGVAGFSDPAVLTQPNGKPVWYQYGWGPGDRGPVPSHYLVPFHVDTAKANGECTPDVTHAWVAQHESWNHGAMDKWVATHVAAQWDGVVAGPMTMGYYTRQDLGFLYALADAFTICDQYFCSVLGPTVPNRLYSMSATVNSEGGLGGPVVDNPGGPIPPGTSLPLVPGTGAPSFHWKTMPEALEEAGVSWKYYQPPGSQVPDFVSNNPLLYFPRFRNPASPLFRKGVSPTFPGDFQADVASGGLPHVSFVASMSGLDEHPPSPVPVGEHGVTRQVLATLLSNPEVWESTVVFVTYDENGGFFDHVAPPTPPVGTPGEWLATKPAVGDSGGIKGPIGLGFRVPTLVLSPYSVGGFLCSDVFDHTSPLRFVETCFGVRVPNLSAWRRAHVGDLTSALNFAGGPRIVPAAIKSTVAEDGGTVQDLVKVAQQCPVTAPLDGFGQTQPYPVPRNKLPAQERGARRRPSGPVTCRS